MASTSSARGRTCDHGGPRHGIGVGFVFVVGFGFGFGLVVVPCARGRASKWRRVLRRMPPPDVSPRADVQPCTSPEGGLMTRPSACRRGYTRGWQRIVRNAIEVHVRLYGWTCPGYGVPAHHS